MNKKFALALSASCLAAASAIFPVSASAQDLGALQQLSSLSVSLFGGQTVQPAQPGNPPAPSTSSSASSTSSTSASPSTSAAPSTSAEPSPNTPVSPHLINDKSDYAVQVAAFDKYLDGQPGKQTFNVSKATGDNASGYLLVAGNQFNRIAAGQGYQPSGKAATANLDKIVQKHNCSADDVECGAKLEADIEKNFASFNGFEEKSVALAVAKYYGFKA
ncbi:MAG: hypothetical protein Q4A82_03085 [Corynebacterium sp.]|nr:hypothetical protein [Corynebacterium sp.]